MRKITLALAAILGFGLMNESKAQTFDEGTNVVNLTAGFGSNFYPGTYNQTPGVAVSVDHSFWGDLINGDFSVGLGGYFGMSWANYDYGAATYNYFTMLPGVRGHFHWTGVENLDTYAGLLTGARIVSGDYDNGFPGYVEPNKTGVYTNGFIGARYYFSDTFCVTAEMGAGINYLNLGVGWKF